MAGHKGQAACSEGLKIVPRPFRKGPPKGQWPDLARLKSGKRRGTAFGVTKRSRPSPARPEGGRIPRVRRFLAGAIAPAMRCRCHIPAGGQSPRPAPAPPLAGASHPPGRALAFVVLGGTVLWDRDFSPGGETRCVSLSARNGNPLLPDQEDSIMLRAARMPAEQTTPTPTRPYTPARPSRISRRMSLAASGILVPGPKMALTPWSYRNW